jgi:hypothetical protein
VVISSELPTSDREWRARDTSCEQVDSLVVAASDIPDIAADRIPRGAILPKGLNRPRIDLYRTGMTKTCPLDAEGLTAGACAEFE